MPDDMALCMRVNKKNKEFCMGKTAAEFVLILFTEDRWIVTCKNE